MWRCAARRLRCYRRTEEELKRQNTSKIEIRAQSFMPTSSSIIQHEGSFGACSNDSETNETTLRACWGCSVRSCDWVETNATRRKLGTFLECVLSCLCRSE